MSDHFLQRRIGRAPRMIRSRNMPVGLTRACTKDALAPMGHELRERRIVRVLHVVLPIVKMSIVPIEVLWPWAISN